MNGRGLPVTSLRSMSASDCLLPFDFDLPNDAGYRRRTLAVFSANGRSTSELDVRGGRPFECQLLTASNSRTRPIADLARSQEQTRLASLQRPLNGAALGYTKQR